MSWFKALPIQYQIAIVILILIVVYILWQKFSYKLDLLFQPKQVNPETVILQNGQVITVKGKDDLPLSQRTYLESLADKLKKDIYGVNTGGVRDMDIYSEAAGLSDAEVDYLADYYKRFLTMGTSLYDDMGSEWLSWFQDSEPFKNLMLKLEKTGNR